MDPDQDSVMPLPSMATSWWSSVVTSWTKQFRTTFIRLTCRRWIGRTTVPKHLSSLLLTWLARSSWTPWNLRSSEDWRRIHPATLRHQTRFYSWILSRWSGKSQERSLLRLSTMFQKNEWGQRLCSMAISYGSTLVLSPSLTKTPSSKRSPTSSPSTWYRDYGRKKLLITPWTTTTAKSSAKHFVYITRMQPSSSVDATRERKHALLTREERSSLSSPTPTLHWHRRTRQMHSKDAKVIHWFNWEIQ